MTEPTKLEIVWPTDHHPGPGQFNVIGLRELAVPTPFGMVTLQFWLGRRTDGGPHAEFVPDLIRALPLEERVWLSSPRGKAVVDQTLLEAVRREWERPDRQ